MNDWGRAEPIEADRQSALGLRRIAQKAMMQAVADSGRDFDCAPESTIATLADMCIFTFADADRAATIKYFGALLDTIAWSPGTPPPGQGRDQATGRLH